MIVLKQKVCQFCTASKLWQTKQFETYLEDGLLKAQLLCNDTSRVAENHPEADVQLQWRNPMYRPWKTSDSQENIRLVYLTPLSELIHHALVARDSRKELQGASR